MIFDAAQLARGWLSIAHAASTDKARPQLYQTIRVEQYPTGLRLVATDTYVLLHTFVPRVDAELEPAPDLDEAPIHEATAMDLHGRGRDLMKHLLKLATTKVDGIEPDPIDVRVRVNVPTDTDAQGALEGFEGRAVVIEHPDVERLALPVYDGAYPDYRELFDTSPDTVDGAAERIALGPDTVARLAKVGKLHPDARIGWTFGTGPRSPIRVDVVDSDPHVDGLVQPTRWEP